MHIANIASWMFSKLFLELFHCIWSFVCSNISFWQLFLSSFGTTCHETGRGLLWSSQELDLLAGLMACCTTIQAVGIPDASIATLIDCRAAATYQFCMAISAISRKSIPDFLSSFLTDFLASSVVEVLMTPFQFVGREFIGVFLESKISPFLEICFSYINPVNVDKIYIKFVNLVSVILHPLLIP